MKNDPAASCRFFSAEDACRFALSAYYAASAQIEPPSGEPWMLEGHPYSGPSDFVYAFCQQVADRVSAEAYAQGLRCDGCTIAGPGWPNKGEELTEGAHHFLRRIGKDLPPVDNPGNNPSCEELLNG